MVIMLNKYILSILVYNLLLDRQRNISKHRNISIHQYLYYKSNYQKIRLSDWAKKTQLNTEIIYKIRR